MSDARMSGRGRRRVPRAAVAGLSAGLALVVAASAGTLATGLRGAVPAQVSTEDPLPPNELPGVPIPPGQIDAAIAQVDGMAQDLMRRTGVPGMAVAVVRGDEPVFLKGYGVRKVGEPGRVDPDTVFQLASMSKSIGSTVVANRVWRGDVAWDTPVRQHLPWFRLADPWVGREVTVGDMYAHRSGLPGHVGDDLEDIGYSRSQILAKLRYAPLSPFRASYAYTNFGLTAGAQAVAVASGKRWAALSRDVLYRPLGMTRTSSEFSAYVNRANRAHTHQFIDGRYVYRFTQNANAQSPAGGVSSSARDLSKWLAMLLGDGAYKGTRVTSQAALLQALTPQAVATPPANDRTRTQFYGYGFDLQTKPSGRTVSSHSGAFVAGVGTNFLVMPSADVAIVAITNGFPRGVPETLNAQFADLVQFGELREPWYDLYSRAYAALAAPFGSLVGKKRPADPAPSRPTPALVGTYANPYYGPARVVVTSGKLRLVMGPARRTYTLRPWNGNTFVFSVEGGNFVPGSLSKATFRIGSNGRATSLVLEALNQEGQGTFRR